MIFSASIEKDKSNKYGNHISHLFNVSNLSKSFKLGVDMFVEIPLEGKVNLSPTSNELIVCSISIDLFIN